MGLPTVFIRLTGCPLRCGYCDTTYAFQGGEWMQIDQILAQVGQYNTPYVTVTGGEPLAQKKCQALMTALCDKGYAVSLETSGALDISQVDPRVDIVMDVKTPGSGEEGKNLYANLQYLRSRDQIKFVISNQEDYLWAKALLTEEGLTERCEILFSPVFNTLDAPTLAEWILNDQLKVRMQVQLHKILWGDKPGH